MSLSPASFARAFRRRFGTTVTDYLGRIRVAQVAQNLVSTDLPVTELALRAGYSNLSHFNQRFRLVMGVTPREYRQRQGVLTPEACG